MDPTGSPPTRDDFGWRLVGDDGLSVQHCYGRFPSIRSLCLSSQPSVLQVAVPLPLYLTRFARFLQSWHKGQSLRPWVVANACDGYTYVRLGRSLLPSGCASSLGMVQLLYIQLYVLSRKKQNAQWLYDLGSSMPSKL